MEVEQDVRTKIAAEILVSLMHRRMRRPPEWRKRRDPVDGLPDGEEEEEEEDDEVVEDVVVDLFSLLPETWLNRGLRSPRMPARPSDLAARLRIGVKKVHGAARRNEEGGGQGEAGEETAAGVRRRRGIRRGEADGEGRAGGGVVVLRRGGGRIRRRRPAVFAFEVSPEREGARQGVEPGDAFGLRPRRRRIRLVVERRRRDAAVEEAEGGGRRRGMHLAGEEAAHRRRCSHRRG